MSPNVSTTLEVIFKGGGASQLAGDIKNVGTAAGQTEGMVTRTKSAVDKMSQGTTTLGGKLKTLGSGFEGIVANVGTFSLSIVNLMSGILILLIIFNNYEFRHSQHDISA